MMLIVLKLLNYKLLHNDYKKDMNAIICLIREPRWDAMPVAGHYKEGSWCNGYIRGFNSVCNYDLCNHNSCY